MKSLVEINRDAYDYNVDGEPRVDIQVFQNEGTLVIVTKVNGQLSSLALPSTASRGLLETLAAALDHEVIAKEDGTIRFYKD